MFMIPIYLLIVITLLLQTKIARPTHFKPVYIKLVCLEKHHSQKVQS